jgi:hypothetical protein
MRAGWFGDHSAAYLAAGRPAIIEDMGFSAHLPRDQGLVAFSSIDSAAESIARVEADYARHAKAARRVTEDYFCAEKVLAPLLNV